MNYVHVRNLEKYQPGYKDRRHIWAKIYFEMIQGNEEAEMLGEIEFSRLVKFIVMESCRQKEIPLDINYLSKRGFDFGLQSLETTVNLLSHFIAIIDVTEPLQNRNETVTKPSPRLEEIREEKRESSAHAQKFIKPKLEEVRSLFQEKGCPAEAEKFFDYYEANGWRVGKNPMKNWRAAVANWLRHAQVYGTQNGVQKPAGRDYKRENAEFAQKLSAWQQESA